MIHHARDGGGRIETGVFGSGTLRLDPPGLEVEVEALLPPAEA